MTMGRSRSNPAHGGRGTGSSASCSRTRGAKRAPAPAIHPSSSAMDDVTETGCRSEPRPRAAIRLNAKLGPVSGRACPKAIATAAARPLIRPDGRIHRRSTLTPSSRASLLAPQQHRIGDDRRGGRRVPGDRDLAWKRQILSRPYRTSAALPRFATEIILIGPFTARS